MQRCEEQVKCTTTTRWGCVLKEWRTPTGSKFLRCICTQVSIQYLFGFDAWYCKAQEIILMEKCSGIPVLVSRINLLSTLPTAHLRQSTGEKHTPWFSAKLK